MRLVPFPSSPAFANTITADVTLTHAHGGLEIAFSFCGAGVNALVLPPHEASPTRKDELWKHTCFEAFFATTTGREYYEFNGSPSGDWALYHFDDYRQGRTPQAIDPAPLLRQLELNPGELDAIWHIPHFSTNAIDCTSTIDCVGITAILQDNTGTYSYWALAHAGSKPDFHLRESFILKLT